MGCHSVLGGPLVLIPISTPSVRVRRKVCPIVAAMFRNQNALRVLDRSFVNPLEVGHLQTEVRFFLGHQLEWGP